MAIVRRWNDDFVGKRGQTMFAALVDNGEIAKATGGEWTGVRYYASKWFFMRILADGSKEYADEPFAYGFSLSAMEHDKSTSYPSIKTIVFDEFLSRQAYLQDEFVLWLNVISTIIRQRTDCKIFMLGNTVNKFCPYFREMGLTKIKDQKQGTIDIYKYGDSPLTVAVEYCAEMDKVKKKNAYFFAFDNPKLQMITGGAWEVDIYPHCPHKYAPKDVMFTYFIDFNGDLLQCEIICKEMNYYTFIHRKTTPIKDPDRDIVFSPTYHPGVNWRRRITVADTSLGRRILGFFSSDRVYYQDNEVGEVVRNYLLWCKRG